MENKEVVSGKSMANSLIGYWLIWGVVFYIVYKILIRIVLNNVDSIFISGLSAVIIQGILAIIVWKISTSFAFNKKTIVYNDVPTVMKKLVIFTILICAFNAIINQTEVNGKIDDVVKSNMNFKMQERMAVLLYDYNQMLDYNQKKENMIKDIKNKMHTYLAILDVGLTVTYLAILPIEKRELLKYVYE